MRPQLSVSSSSHKLVSRSPSPIISTQDRMVYKMATTSPQGPAFLHSSPFRKQNSFLNSPNNTNSAVKQLQLLPNVHENLQDPLYLPKDFNFSKQTISIPKDVVDRMKNLESENNQLKNQISLLNGMNQTKENYIKDLEEKISTLYSDNRKEEETSYALKKKEEHFSILLKEQKKLFDNKEKIMLKELDDVKSLMIDKSLNCNFLDKSDNSKDFTKNSKEYSRNAEIEKTYLESTLKIYKVNIAELETKILVLNNENNKLTKMLNDKMNENIEVNKELEMKLKYDFDGQRTEIEGKLTKILEENKKIVTFNNSLLAELDHYKSLNETLHKKHQDHIEELKVSWRNQTEKRLEDFKNKNLSDKKNLESQINLSKDFTSDLERRYQDVLEENNKLRTLVLEKDSNLSELKEKLSYLEGKTLDEEKIERILFENQKKMKDYEDKNNHLLTENIKMKEISENCLKELELWKNKYTSNNESHSKIVEEMKANLENRRSFLIESEIKQKTSQLENEKNNLKTKLLILEAEKKSFEDKISLLTEESQRFEQIIYERMEEIIKLTDELKSYKLIHGEWENQKGMLSEKNDKISELENSINSLLSENNKLNQTMRVSINEKELLITKFEAFKQEYMNRIEEMKLKHSKELSIEVKKGVESYMEKLMENERKNELFCKELKQMNLIQDNLNQTLNNYSAILLEKENEIEILREEIVTEKTRNEQSRLEQEKIQLEKDQLLQKINKLEENHQVQLKELRNNFKTAELTFEDKKKMEEEYNKEVSLHRSSLRMAKERLLECHRVILSLKGVKINDDIKNNVTGIDLQRNLEEAEQTIFHLKDVLNEKDTINPYNKAASNEGEYTSFWEESHINNNQNIHKKQEISNKLIEIEKEHTKCYEDLRVELDVQTRNHALMFNKLKDEYDIYRQKCSMEHLKVIATLENQLNGITHEKESMREELLGEIDRLRGEINGLISNCQLSNDEFRFNCERELQNRLKIETFQSKNEINELKRVIFELEDNLLHANKEIQFQKTENLHMKNTLEVLSQKNPYNSENRKILGSLENRSIKNIEAIEKYKQNEVLKARISELENLNKSFDSLRIPGKIDGYHLKQKPFNKPMNMLSENERLNAQILKRCREILN